MRHQCLQFNGISQGVYINDVNAYNMGTGSFTLECWVKNSTAPNSGNILYKQGASTTRGYSLKLGYASCVPFTRIHDGTHTAAAFSGTSVLDGNWHHLAAVRDTINHKLIMYVDGAITGATNNVDESSVVDSISELQTYFGIGARFTTTYSDTYFPGSIDDVRIWNIARTQSEIQTNMNRELTGTETGLIGYWEFNDGSGATASNLANVSYPGVLYGSPTWIQDFSNAQTRYFLSMLPEAEGVFSSGGAGLFLHTYLFGMMLTKGVGGTFAPTGSLSRVIDAFRSLGGSLTSNGALSTLLSAYRNLGGNLTPTGSLLESLILTMVVGGELTLNGSINGRNPAWLLLDDELIWRGEWDANYAYDLNDVVLHPFGNEWHVFVSKAGHNTGNIPVSSATWWRRLYQEQWL